MTILLDSVILIDHLNGVPAATEYLLRNQGQCLTSVITRAEVLAGLDQDRVPQVLRLLDRFPTLAIDRQIADSAAALRRQHRWRLPDAFQASLAQHHHLRLATRNHRDFPPAKFEFVVIPYSL